MKINALFTILVAICCLASCKPKDTPQPQITLVLNAPEVSGNKVNISWSGLKDAHVQSITLMRIVDSTTNYLDAIKLDSGATQYTDTFLLTRYVQYYVIARVGDGYNALNIKSNKQVFVRTDIKPLDITPLKALLDRDTHLIYIASEEGDMAIYDANSNSTIKKISPGVSTGWCLGTYNGKKELYTSRYDGWMFIYDATTLEIIDQVNVGTPLGGILYNNGKLFINAYSTDSGVVVYDRASKTKISSAPGYYWTMNMKLLPGTNTSFLGIYSTGSVSRFNFSSDGMFLSKQENTFTQEIYFRPFEVFPDGDKFITSTVGTVISKDLAYISGLPHGSLYYNSYDFDNTNKLIYAGCTDMGVDVYSMDNYHFIKRLPTKGYSIAVFYDNGAIISLSSQFPNPSYSSFAFVEQL